MTYTEIAERCVQAWTADGLSDKTIHAYLLVLARADVALGELGEDLLTATPSSIRRISDSWPRTRSSRVQLRTALARCWEACGCGSAPLGAVRVPSKPKYGCRALSEPQAALVAKVARANSGPEGLAVLLALYAGLRREEIARLAWADVDLEAGWLRVVGKGDVTAELPIHPELSRRLSSLERCGPHVFPGSRGRAHVTPATVWNWTRAISRVAIGEVVAPHRLRHTAIATLNDATGDLRTAQAFGRHASPETTVIYTRFPRRRLVEAVEALEYH